MQETADKVLYVYSNTDPSRLSTLILRPLIEGFASELAVKLLKKLKKLKTYRLVGGKLMLDKYVIEL